MGCSGFAVPNRFKLKPSVAQPTGMLQSVFTAAAPAASFVLLDEHRAENDADFGNAVLSILQL